VIIALFVIGALTSLGCGANVVASKSDGWKTEAVWMFGGVVGAAIMIAAVLLGGR
jgi:hypothetical protein